MTRVGAQEEADLLPSSTVRSGRTGEMFTLAKATIMTPEV